MSVVIDLVLIRHGRTAWNEDGRIQGHEDLALSQRGKEEIGALRVPEAFAGRRWVTSPLGRARQTAQLLGLDAKVEAAWIEMDWGAWSGARLDELRAIDPDGMAANENEGLHFRPRGGETPAEVQARVMAWLAAQPPGPIGAVTHKGVILALIARAVEWDMLGKPPVKVNWTALHHVRLIGGRLEAVALNVPLAAKDPG